MDLLQGLSPVSKLCAVTTGQLKSVEVLLILRHYGFLEHPMLQPPVLELSHHRDVEGIGRVPGNTQQDISQPVRADLPGY